MAYKGRFVYADSEVVYVIGLVKVMQIESLWYVNEVNWFMQIAKLYVIRLGKVMQIESLWYVNEVNWFMQIATLYVNSQMGWITLCRLQTCNM